MADDFKRFACKLGASEIHDCDPRKNREGVILGVSPTKLWVDWHTGVKTWVSLSRCHANPERKTGYYVPELREEVGENET